MHGNRAMYLVCHKSFVIQTMGKAALLSHAIKGYNVKKGPKIDHYFIDGDTG